MNSASRTRRPGRWLALGLLLALAWLVFHLFEPVFTWKLGWHDLPLGEPQAVGTSAPYWASVAERADALLRQAYGRLQAPAVSAAVMVDGEQAWAGAIGLADAGTGESVTLDSRFRIGSTSKAVTGLALGVLVEAGLIDLDHPIHRYLPELPGHYRDVTARLAMSHLAGIPDYGWCPCFPVWEHRNRRHFESVRQALTVFVDRPLLAPPGTAFRYSSYGTNLVGAAIEAVARQPFNDFVAEAVFRPLGMGHSGPDLAGANLPERVAFHEIEGGRWKYADPVDNSIRYPAGGMLSTPSDMLRLGRGFLSDALLDRETRDLLVTPQVLADGSANPQGYALGIRAGTKTTLAGLGHGTAIWSHHGTAVGSTSYFAIYPELGIVISVMMNKGQTSVEALAPEADRLVELFLPPP
ncbi:MAG: beta-lactamase family protein [Xanthomonadales bacterium]|nr:beta-lactamase family protein [Xanthomonadales bacterium]